MQWSKNKLIACTHPKGKKKPFLSILVCQTIIPCFSCLLTPNIKDQTIGKAEDGGGANKATNKRYLFTFINQSHTLTTENQQDTQVETAIYGSQHSLSPCLLVLHFPVSCALLQYQKFYLQPLKASRLRNQTKSCLFICQSIDGSPLFCFRTLDSAAPAYTPPLDTYSIYHFSAQVLTFSAVGLYSNHMPTF